MINPEESVFDALYNGWHEYRKEIRGYLTTPTKVDIKDWERFKKTVFDAVEEANGRTTATQLGFENCQDSGQQRT